MLSWDFAPPGISPMRLGQRFRRPPPSCLRFAGSHEDAASRAPRGLVARSGQATCLQVAVPLGVFHLGLALGTPKGHPGVSGQARPVRREGGCPPRARDPWGPHAALAAWLSKGRFERVRPRCRVSTAPSPPGETLPGFSRPSRRNPYTIRVLAKTYIDVEMLKTPHRQGFPRSRTRGCSDGVAVDEAGSAADNGG
jgi:hypothetical protein